MNDLLRFDGKNYWFDKVVPENGPFKGGPFSEKLLVFAGWKDYIIIAKRKYKLEKLLNE